MEHLPCNRISSSSSVEGELAPGIFEANSPKYGAAIFQASINEQSSSLEGEIFSDVTDEPKEGLPAVSPDNSERIGQESTSATLQQTKEAETPRPGTRRRGKTTSIAMFSPFRKLHVVLVFGARFLVSNVYKGKL